MASRAQPQAQVTLSTAAAGRRRQAETAALGDAIAELAARIQAATYELLVMIHEFDEREGWGEGFKSCAHWQVAPSAIALAFGHRCLSPSGVARWSNTAGILAPRALLTERLGALGAHRNHERDHKLEDGPRHGGGAREGARGPRAGQLA